MSERFDPSTLNSIDEIEAAVKEHEHTIFKKTKLISQIRDQKSEANAAFREQMKEIQEELDHEVDITTAIFDRKKVLGYV